MHNATQQHRDGYGGRGAVKDACDVTGVKHRARRPDTGRRGLRRSNRKAPSRARRGAAEGPLGLTEATYTRGTRRRLESDSEASVGSDRGWFKIANVV